MKCYKLTDCLKERRSWASHRRIWLNWWVASAIISLTSLEKAPSRLPRPLRSGRRPCLPPPPPAYLLGESDEKEKPTGAVADGLSAKERELIDLFRGLSPAEQDAQLALWKARL